MCPLPLQAASRSDSLTLTPGPWLGLPAVPAVTLYRHEDPAMVGGPHADGRSGRLHGGVLSDHHALPVGSGGRADLQPAGGEAASAAPLAVTAAPGTQRDHPEDPPRRRSGEHQPASHLRGGFLFLLNYNQRAEALVPEGDACLIPSLSFGSCSFLQPEAASA